METNIIFQLILSLSIDKLSATEHLVLFMADIYIYIRFTLGFAFQFEFLLARQTLTIRIGFSGWKKSKALDFIHSGHNSNFPQHLNTCSQSWILNHKLLAPHINSFNRPKRTDHMIGGSLPIFLFIFFIINALCHFIYIYKKNRTICITVKWETLWYFLV